MYQNDQEPPLSTRPPDGPARIAPEERARHALARVENALTDSPLSPLLDMPRLRAALAAPLADPELEQRRRFALGWLAWLDGDPSSARTILTGCTGARPAYWLSRCRLLLRDVEGLSAFEQQMRTFQGSPQATCWFVDLLWRAGQHDRAVQVWKSVRVNKRIAACEEAPLLEARSFIAQDDFQAAEKTLFEASLGNGVLRAEQQLLLAWLARARHDDQSGPTGSTLLPRAASRAWERLLRRDDSLSFDDLLSLPLSPPARSWVGAQHVRGTGGDPSSTLAFVTLPRLARFVRYVRAAIGQDDVATLLASLPGPFLASRCRLWVTLTRFCRREATPSETLVVIEQARKAGYGVAAVEPWLDLARHLTDPATTPDTLWEGGTNNHRRAAVELCLSRGSPDEVSARLTAWIADPRLDVPLRFYIGRELLRRRVGASVEDLLAASESLALRQLWQVAQGQAAPETLRPHVGDEAAGPLALCLLTFDAAARADASALSELLAPSGLWHRLTSGPPAFLCQALLRVAGSERWRDPLTRWLAQWSAPTTAMQALTTRAGLTPPQPDSAPPHAVEPASWFLRQASQALGGNNALVALAWVERARQHGLLALDEDRRRIVEAALPDLERLARATHLARMVRLDESHPFTDPALLIDFADLLQQHSFETTTPEALMSLAERPDLPPRLAHHLALVNLRSADQFERQERDDLASPCWKRSWRAWLTWAAADIEAGTLVIDHLFERHRGRLADLLARNAVTRARPLWDLLQSLPRSLPQPDSPLALLLRTRLEQFRDRLATAFLLDTREAMRHGAIPEGWRADYEQGLSRLRRLMSLDRDNRGLLTALVETCADWFLDLYDLRDETRLRQEVDRFTPFALQLARAVGKPDQTWPQELSARAALAEFFKFRAFVTDDPEHKRALYREALVFNPANDNVRGLLGGLEGPKS